MVLKLQEGDTVLMDQMIMQKSFHRYYSNLYRGHNIPLEKIGEYLKKNKVIKDYRETNTNCEWTYKNIGNFSSNIKDSTRKSI